MECIWMPHIMARTTIMCVVMAVKPHVFVDRRETPEQSHGSESGQCCNPPSTTLHLCFALSVYVITLFSFQSSSLALTFRFHFMPLTTFQISGILFLSSLWLSNFSRFVLWPEGLCLQKNVLYKLKLYCGYSLKGSTLCHSVPSNQG